jgi:hypothetical protein
MAAGSTFVGALRAKVVRRLAGAVRHQEQLTARVPPANQAPGIVSSKSF